MGSAVSSGFSAPAAVAAVDNLTNEMFYVADTGHNQVILCQVPDQNADAILVVWNGMTNRLPMGIFPARQIFFEQNADNYNQAFLPSAHASLIPVINQIGTLTPDIH